MLVKCICNRIDDLVVRSEIRTELHDSYHLPNGEVHLTVDHFYIVYALEIRNSSPWYLVADDNFARLHYPIEYSAAFFHVVDNRLSRLWRYLDAADDLSQQVCKLAPIEWAEDKLFYEKLLDGDPNTTASFDSIREI